MVSSRLVKTFFFFLVAYYLALRLRTARQCPFQVYMTNSVGLRLPVIHETIRFRVALYALRIQSSCQESLQPTKYCLRYVRSAYNREQPM